MKTRMSLLLVAMFIITLVMAVPPAKALELKPGLDVKGQWERSGNKGYFTRLKVLSLDGKKVRLAYGVGRFGYDNITEDDSWKADCNVIESHGIKKVKFTCPHFLFDMFFEFNPSLPYVKGTWTSTRNETWHVEMK